ncbi:hypothetical protein LSUE1_G004065, partial [Lachnellula suecica]
MGDIEETKSQLLEEYGVIDSSTLLAILSDYDLNDEGELSAAKQTLDILKATVLDDEASGFDASGASAHILIDGAGEHGENDSRSGSGHSGRGWASQTDDTSMTHEMAFLELEGQEYTPHDTPSPTEEAPETTFTSQLDSLGEKEKEAALMGIFPILRLYDVQWCLKKNQGNASRAIDELMNESFLEENGIRHKGIEAFSESDIPPRPRKGKGKKKKGRLTEDDTSAKAADSPVQSKWETGKQDVDFISSRIGTPRQQVSSMYHNSGGSVRGTITAIIESHKAMEIEDDDAMVQIYAFDLRQDFPSIPMADLEALIQLTH